MKPNYFAVTATLMFARGVTESLEETGIEKKYIKQELELFQELMDYLGDKKFHLFKSRDEENDLMYFIEPTAITSIVLGNFANLAIQNGCTAEAAHALISYDPTLTDPECCKKLCTENFCHLDNISNLLGEGNPVAEINKLLLSLYENAHIRNLFVIALVTSVLFEALCGELNKKEILCRIINEKGFFQVVPFNPNIKHITHQELQNL